MLPKRIRFAPAIFSLAVITSSAGAAVPGRLEGDGPARAHYNRCLALGASNPGAALSDADAWARSGGGIAAEHCAALALVGLKRYAEAGTRLDALGKLRDVPGDLRPQIFDQAGNAWILAGFGARAVSSFSAALTLSAGDADLFADLARAQAMQKNWQEVALDLNAALTLNPRRADLLILRASARRALKQYPGARDDIETALKLRPGEGEALVERGLLRRQLGDIGGARRDFAAALKSAPGGDVALTAQENLDALNEAR